MKITKKTENIRFSSIDFIEEFFAGLKEEEPEFSFSEEEVIEEWKDLLLEQFEVQGMNDGFKSCYRKFNEYWL